VKYALEIRVGKSFVATCDADRFDSVDGAPSNIDERETVDEATAIAAHEASRQDTLSFAKSIGNVLPNDDSFSNVFATWNGVIKNDANNFKIALIERRLVLRRRHHENIERNVLIGRKRASLGQLIGDE